MAAKNETIFPLSFNGPSRACVPLFPFLSLKAKHSIIQFLFPSAGPLPGKDGPFRQYRSECHKLVKNSHHRKDIREVSAQHATIKHASHLRAEILNGV
jgi:hypothetical protein